MAEEKSNPNAKDAANPAEEEYVHEELPDELDEAGLDDFLRKEDPAFSDTLVRLGADKNLVAQDISLTDSEQLLADELLSWQNGTKWQKMAVRVLPFIPRVSLFIQAVKFKLFQILRGLSVRFKNFCYYLATDGRKKLIGFLKHGATSFVGVFTSSIKRFGTFSIPKKLLALGSLLLAVATALFIYRSYTHGIIKAEEELFIPSMAAVASESYDYDPAEESEPLYDNLRATQNLFLFPKMVVNLKRMPGLKPNPMCAFEFFVEGMVPEVIVELKDREAMFKDVVQRVIEGYTFEQLDTPEGKTELRDNIQKELNTLMTKGTVRRVLIKTIILKP